MTPRAGLALVALVAFAACQPPAGVGGAPARDAGVHEASTVPETAPAPGHVTFMRDGMPFEFAGAELAATCTGGHRGINARRAGEHFGLNVFIFKPGAYDCADQQPYIFFHLESATLPATYTISAVEAGGSCTLVIDSLTPRMSGRFDARLAREPRAPGGEVAIAGSFDVPFPPMPSCP